MHSMCKKNFFNLNPHRTLHYTNTQNMCLYDGFISYKHAGKVHFWMNILFSKSFQFTVCFTWLDVCFLSRSHEQPENIPRPSSSGALTCMHSLYFTITRSESLKPLREQNNLFTQLVLRSCACASHPDLYALENQYFTLVRSVAYKSKCKSYTESEQRVSHHWSGFDSQHDCRGFRCVSRWWSHDPSTTPGCRYTDTSHIHCANICCSLNTQINTSV